MTAREAEIIELIHREVKPALGCTEPIAVALAVAKAVEILAENGCDCDPRCRLWRETADFRISVEVSGNILKNGMGVGIPGTGMIGLHIAAALGAVCGRSELGLEVLQDRSEGAVKRARELVDRGLKAYAEKLRNGLQNGFVFISNEANGKVTFVCASSKEAIAKGLKAGDIVKKAAQITGGNGGGRPDMAQAGGRDTSRIDDALQSVRDTLASL